MRVTAFLGLCALAGLFVFGGCGPKYPNCETDEHCKEQNEYCADQLCRKCRDDSHCNSVDPCGACGSSYTCGRKQGCCTSDLDCPGGGCWTTAGQPAGQCGPQCGDGKSCPSGQRCNAQGQCEPDAVCGPTMLCPVGKRCDNGQCVIACTTTAVNFDFNESRIRVDQHDTLNANGDCIKTMGKAVRIEGHCDERGTEEYNMALGERRATRSKKFLQRLGIDSNSMRTISYGEERLTCIQASSTCWSENRRAEFVFE